MKTIKNFSTWCVAILILYAITLVAFKPSTKAASYGSYTTIASGNGWQVNRIIDGENTVYVGIGGSGAISVSTIKN